MKKKILLLFALIVSITGAYANNGTLSIQNIRNMIPGYSGSFDIVLSGSDNTYCAFNLNIVMPEGLNYDTYVNGALLSDHTANVTLHEAINEDPAYRTFIVESANTTNFSATNGTLLTIKFTVATNASGSPEGSIFNITMSDNNGIAYSLDELVYSVPVDNTLFLDENDDYTPEAFTGINVHVNRALEANKWSTIVLPFAMTADQVTETFPDGIRIGYFKGMEPHYDVDENFENVTINFENRSAIDAHTPYIIKVPTAMPNGFTANNVTVTEFTGNVGIYNDENKPLINQNGDPIYEGPAVVYGDMIKKTSQGKTKYYYDEESNNDMIGTYKPITIRDLGIFLNNNTFVFSKGKSKLKGFRAYLYNYSVYYVADPSRQFIINFNDDS